MHEQTDILIIGAGIPGLLLAHFLAPHLKVCVLERASLPAPYTPSVKDRVSAINLGSQKILETVGGWPQVAEHAGVVRSMQIIDAAAGETLNFKAQGPHAHLAFIVANAALQSSFRNSLSKAPQCRIDYDVQLEKLERSSRGVCVLTQEGHCYEANLIVGADGANSWVRHVGNLPLIEESYSQTAVVATLEIEKPHEGLARQIFLPTGPLAFLPLADSHQVSIVWSSTRDLLALSAEQWEAALDEQGRSHYGKLRMLSPPQGFPLTMRHAQAYVSEGIALIADAAHTIHPLAGQGLNLGIADSAVLAQVILKAHREGRAYFSKWHLSRYQRIRKLENLKMIQAMKLLNEVFTDERQTVVKLRNAGLQCIEKMDWLKRLLMELAN